LIKIRLILLSSWLGAAVFFSAVVAPSVFGALHAFELSNANEIAGTIVTRSLSVVNVSGFIIALLSFCTILIMERKQHGLSYSLVGVALVVMAMATSIGNWVIAARMRALRTSMVVIDQVPFDDPRRIAFNHLHHYSVISLSIAMCAAILAILLIRTRSVR